MLKPVFLSQSIQGNSNPRQQASSYALASTYENRSDYRERTSSGLGRTVYDTNGTSLSSSLNESELAPGSDQISTQVHSLAIVNNIFHYADSDGDGNLSGDELDTYISQNESDMDAEELAAAKFLQQQYGALSSEDGESANLTLDDLGSASETQDDDGLSDADVSASFGTSMMEEEAARLGITVDELRARIYGN